MPNEVKTDSENKFSIARGVLSEEFRATELGVSRSTLVRARSRGELGWVRIGDRPFYSDRHISEWLETLEREARETTRVVQRAKSKSQSKK